MISTETLKEYLTFMMKKYPCKIHNKLQKGDLVTKSWGLNYLIDNMNICDELLDSETEKRKIVPLKKIYEKMNPEKLFAYLFSQRRKIIPYSEIFNQNLGECVEISIAVQLLAQTKAESYQILGNLELFKDLILEDHAYNIIFTKDNKAFLIDAANPLWNEKKEFHCNYTAPIIDINFKEGEIIVPKEWKQGRTYLI